MHFNLKISKSLSIHSITTLARVSKIMTSPSQNIVPMDTVHMIQEGTAYFEASFYLFTPVPACNLPSTLTNSTIPKGPQNPIEIPLGVVSRQRLMLLDITGYARGVLKPLLKLRR